MGLVTVAGYAVVLYVLAKLLTYLSKYVRSPLDVNRIGEWTLVTGATDGIGNIRIKLSIQIADSNISSQEREYVRSWPSGDRTSCWSAGP